MFKQIITLVRGRQHEAKEAFIDRHALPLLRQQIRDAAQAVEASRRAVALAMVQNEQEKSHLARLAEQIAELEERTLMALDKGNEMLALEAADTIAHLEAERETSTKAQTRFEEEIARLRANLREGEGRLRQLKRGQRLAVATDRTQRLRLVVPDAGAASLRDAEDTLSRLQSRQTDIDATARAMTELEVTGSVELLRKKMADAGCGLPIRTSAEMVLERLKGKTTKTA